MVQNVEPIFPKTPHVSWTDAVLTANTTKDGTAGTVTLAFTAGAYGSFIEKITGMPLGTNIQSVARIFLNNGLTNATAANNSLIDQIDLPAITNIENAGVARVALPLNIAIPAGYRLYIVIGTTVASGWEFTVWGGDY
jgi:hypothetical protein